MLYSVELRLKNIGGSNPIQVSGYHAYSLFLRLLERADASISASLHQDGGPKPFTVSAPAPLARGTASKAIADGQEARIRLTFMDEGAFSTILDAVWKLPEGVRFPLGGAIVAISAILTTPSQSAWASCASFQQLMDDASDDRRLSLVFLSPTTFRSKGERNLLFPEPELVFGSLLARWNAFAPPGMALAGNEDLGAAVRPSSYRLSTRLLDFGEYQERGFIGEVTYEITNKLTTLSVRALQALGAFSFFSGVGAKTTMGLGQTRRRQDARPVPD